MSEWQPIETAPKNEWVQLWRPSCDFADSNPLIIGKWSEKDGAFIWPDSPFDPFFRKKRADWLVSDDFYASNQFTHWMPLPEPPK